MVRGLSSAAQSWRKGARAGAQLVEQPQAGGVADGPAEVAQLGTGVGRALLAEGRVQDHGAVDLVDHHEDGRDLR